MNRGRKNISSCFFAEEVHFRDDDNKQMNDKRRQKNIKNKVDDGRISITERRSGAEVLLVR